MSLRKKFFVKGFLTLLFGVISVRSIGGELVKGKIDNDSLQVKVLKSKINDIKERYTKDDGKDYEAYNSDSATSFNAYSQGEFVYIPYSFRGKYVDVPYGEGNYSAQLANERMLAEKDDPRVREWNTSKYNIKSVNGNDYDYVGEYKRIYSEKKQVGNVYYRDFYSKKKIKKYKTRYRHTYRGAHWWNCLIFTFRTTDSSSAPIVPNFNRVSTSSFEEYQGYDEINVFEKREYSEWRTSSPWRWFWEPEWRVFSTQERFRLYLEDIKKWDWQGDNKFLKLPSLPLKRDKVNGKDIFAFHLQQWYGISNFDNKGGNTNFTATDIINDKIKNGKAGGVDYFYFYNEKILTTILDEIIDSKDYLLHYLDQENSLKNSFWSSVLDYSICSAIEFLLGLLKGPMGVIASQVFSIVCFITDLIEKHRMEKKKDALHICGEEMKAKLRNKDNLLNNKYTVLKINADGYWIDFVDNIDNPYDDIQTVSLKYENNYRLNGKLHEYKNNTFTNIFGYPSYVSSWDSVTKAMAEIVAEKPRTCNFKLSTLAEQGTYSNLFW